jgi:putative NIF3 family GTP cyclohydrolase 1 type 2
MSTIKNFQIAVVGIAIAIAPGIFASDAPGNAITAQQVVERIQKQTAIPWHTPTVDTFKAGDPSAPVKGIAVTMMATLDVLQRAAAGGANFIITHEPTFYGHLDLLEPLQSENDAVLTAKQEFIKAHGLVIWRFHDHIHQMKPDMIMSGVVKALDWQKFQPDPNKPKFVIPETTLEHLAAQVRDQLGIRTLRVVGDPQLKITKVGLSPGFPGFGVNRSFLQDDAVEVLLLGEAHEWETIEYATDAVAAGKRKALIVLGHIPSEQAGMEECARWLKTFVTEVPVQFVATSEPFWTPPPTK